ncbi:MAG: TPR repeat-containing serine/threonine protein [Planctomycetota bacterium]|nr:MAG: TPR repeat-containing serine/threonine protein [Planctomycetota bacterium]
MSTQDPVSSKETLVLPDAMIGRKVGGYEIRGILGKGGMGVVYRAHDAALDREVALKLLPPALSADAEYSERFIREARMAGKLDHARIVPVYAAGSSDQGAWIAMQLVRGRTLAEELHDGMRPTFSSVLRIAKQTAEALGAAHKAGLIHRDIKPGNLIIDADGNVKVLDFGLARPTIPSGHTQDGTYLGTPEYSSPEQCQTNDIDGRADLYSLGVVMYEMLGGRIPHVAETPLALFTKIVNDEPLALRDLNPKVPPSLAAIVAKLIAKSRDSRYADAAALVADLEKVVGKDGPARPHETVVVGPADRARVAAWTMAGVLATLLVAAVIHSSPWSGAAIGAGNNSGAVATNGSGSGVQPVPQTPTEADGRIVLLDFKNITGSSDLRWLESALPELIASSLATREGLNPLDRDEVTAAMKKEFNARLTSGGGDNVEQAQAQGVKVLEALKAGVLVRGSFVTQGKKLRVLTTVLVRRGEMLEVAGRSQIDEATENILEIADRIAGDIAGALAARRGDRGELEKRLQDKTQVGRLKAADASTSDKLLALTKAGSSLRRRVENFEKQRGGRKEDKKKHGDSPAERPSDDAREPAGAAGVPDAAPAEGAGWTGGARKELTDEEKPEKGHADGGEVAGDKPKPATPPPAGKDDSKAEPERQAPQEPEIGQNQEEHLREDHFGGANAEDLLRELRKYAEEIRESEKDLAEVELGAEGTAK